LGPNRVTQLVIVARSVIGFGAIGLAFLAVQNLPVGDATVLCGLSPIFTSIGATCLLGEKYGFREFGGVVFSLAGVVMISRPSFLFGGVCNLELGVGVKVGGGCSRENERVVGRSRARERARTSQSVTIRSAVQNECHRPRPRPYLRWESTMPLARLSCLVSPWCSFACWAPVRPCTGATCVLFRGWGRWGLPSPWPCWQVCPSVRFFLSLLNLRL
jgi:hypothetical protein